jgi:uncharacterized protein (DUF3084 family)
LIFEFYELKKKMRVMEDNLSQLKGENKRIELDSTKQQKRIELLLTLSEGGKNFALSADMRKELEKSMLVRQLKAQINLLRGTISGNEAELEELKRSLKASHVLELETEKDEYYHECLLLRSKVQELSDELEREKQKKEWNSKLAGGAGEELRKEVAKLANGYQTILTNISVKGNNNNNRPSSSTGVANRSNKGHNAVDDVNHSKPKRPQSATYNKPAATTININNNNNISARDELNAYNKKINSGSSLTEERNIYSPRNFENVCNIYYIYSAHILYL